MGTIGVLMSMASNDPAVAGRQAAVQAALTSEGITSPTTSIQFGYAFDNFPGGNLQYGSEADRLLQLANANPPSSVFASCWNTMTSFQGSGNYRNHLITYAGLFHDGENNFGQYVAGVYSHMFQPCSQWVKLLKGAVPGLKNIGVIFDNVSANAATNYYNYLQAAVSGAFTLFKIPIDQTVASTGAVSALINANLLTPHSGRTIANSGLIVPATAFTANRRSYIIQAANTLNLGAVYPNRMYVENASPYNGLISYGAILLDQYIIAGLTLANSYKNPGMFASGGTANANFETVASQSRATAQHFTIPPGTIIVA
jgi:hypothetical protein